MRLLIAVILFVCVVTYEAKKHKKFSSNREHYGIRMLAANDLPARCKKQVDTKTCQSTDNEYYYDVNADKCRHYDGIGCLKVDSNGNSFKTFEDCVAVCDMRESRCEKETFEANCRNPPRNVFYDKTTKKCLKYKEGKCLRRGSDENSFSSEIECERACERIEDPKTQDPICSKPKVEVDCRPNPNSKIFHYDATSKTCIRAPRRKCFEGDNSFSRVEDCRKSCIIPLNQSPDCVQVIKTQNECVREKDNWFYDVKNEECFQSIFTKQNQCGGAGNSFKDIRACENKCIA